MAWYNSREFELTQPGVAEAPNESGVYGLAKGGAWVYIASTDNIRQALMYYLGGNMPWISQQNPERFVFEVADREQRSARCSELVSQLRPIFLNCV